MPLFCNLLTESPNEERPDGPGYYVDTTVSSSSSNDGIEGNTESIPSTPTEVIQHPPQPQDQVLHNQQQQQLSATIAFHQAAAAQQAAQLAANAAALQAAQAQQAMAAAASQAQTNQNIVMSNAPVPQSMAAMSLQQTMPSVSMPMSCMANGVIASSHVTRAATPMQVPNPVFSDGTVAMGGSGAIPVPMMMQQVQMDPSQQAVMMQQQQHGKGSKNMPPTPPGECNEVL